MITFIVFALAAVCAVEAVLGLALLGLAIVEMGAFLRRHPGGGGSGSCCPASLKPRRRLRAGVSCGAGRAGGFCGSAGSAGTYASGMT